ncbi:MAG: DNA polymerase IV [Clostridia bacterium]|nr:DNA polymerase IV [Clostridia bacterium]
MSRVIFHVDQNCYFASVEMISHPECRNVPMAVAGDKERRHGIILAKNQLASKAGVKTAEAIWQAQRKCPDLVLLPPHYEKYTFYSEKLRELYLEYTDKVEPFGLDECWLDLTETIGDRDPVEVADEIRRRVREEFKLTCSIGVSYNKIFAKLGSDYKKPDATTVISEENFKTIVWELPCSDLLFVGRSTTERLRKVNIRTIGDLANCDKNFLNQYLGKNGLLLWSYANGLDTSEVQTADYRREVKSVGNSTTTAKDMTSELEISATYHTLSNTVASRLRKYNLKGNVVQITVRDSDLHIYEKQRVLGSYTDNSHDIYKAAMYLFKESYDWHTSVRSIGVRVTNLTSKDAPEQLSLFDELGKTEKSDKLERTIDKIKERFGDDSLKVCAELTQSQNINKSPKGTFLRDAHDLDDM